MPRTPQNDYILIKLVKESQVSESGLHVVSSEGKRTDSVALQGEVVGLPDQLYITDNAIKYTDRSGREIRIRLKLGDVVEVGKFELTYTQDPEFAYVALEHILGKVL